MLSSTTTRLRRAAAATLALAALPALLCAATDFPKVIPGNAGVAVWTNDLPALIKAMENSPYGRAYNDPGSAKLRAYVDSKMEEMNGELSHESLPSVKDWQDNLKGGIAGYVDVAVKPTEQDPRLILLVETDEKSAGWLKDMLQQGEGDFVSPEKTTFTASGATVYRVTGQMKDDPTKTVSYNYAFLDKHAVLSLGDSQDPIKTAIAQVKGTGVSALADREDVREYTSKRAFGDNQLNMFFGTKDFIAVADPIADPASKAMLDASGILGIDSLLGSFTFEEKSVKTDFGAVTSGERTGLIDALTSAGGIPLDVLKYAPSDIYSVSAFGFDLGAFFNAAMNLASQASPQAQMMANMYITNFEQQTGADITNGLIKNIAGEHLYYQRPLSEEIVRQLSAEDAALNNSIGALIQFKDGALGESTLKKMIEGISKQPGGENMVTTTENGGVTIVTINNPAMNSGALKLGLAFNQKGIIITNNDVELQQLVRAVTGAAADSITKDPGLDKVMSKAGKDNLLSFTYQPGRNFQHALDQAQTVLNSPMISSEIDVPADILPTAAVLEKYFGDTYAVVRDTPKMIHLSGELMGK